MAFEIPSHFHEAFTRNTELLLQQRSSRFKSAVSTASYSGESAQVVKQFGEVEMAQKTSRNSDTDFSEIQHKQRWVFPVDYDLALPVDREDELRMLDSPVSPYVEACVAGYNRKCDAIVNAAFFGTAKTGENGGTSTAFDSNNVVAVDAGAAAATGMNIEKLIQAKEILTGNEVFDGDNPDEEVYIAITKNQMGDLLRSTEITSSDYAEVKALVQGKIDTFMGFKFLHYQSLSTDSNSYERVPVWAKSGMHLGMWGGLFTRIGERADKGYLTQVYFAATMGATRTQEGKVVEIKCSV